MSCEAPGVRIPLSPLNVLDRNGQQTDKKYLSSQKYVASAEEAARQMEQRYNLGAATVVDYNTALDALVEAQVQLLQAKYEYIFKTEIIKFYLDSNKK